MRSEALLDDLGEHVHHRFYGKYRGTVTQIDGKTLKIKAKVPSVLQGQETGWCTPCVPYAGKGVGIAFLPEKGAGVWIEFERGDVSHPIWSGCYWRDGEIPSDAKPKVKAIVTAAPNTILLNDDAKSITIKDSHGNTITLDDKGITIERGGKKVVISSSGMNVDDGALEVS